MLKEGRPGLTDEQKADMWGRWKAGYSIREICHVLKRTAGAVRMQLGQHGGITPHVRRRSALALTLTEREEISRALCCGRSLRSIARSLGRAPSTISREVARHSGRMGYRANHAEYEASLSALRPKRCRLALNDKLRKVVASKLALEWSPNRFQAGSRPNIRMIRACRCPTKQSTRACSSKHAGS